MDSRRILVLNAGSSTLKCELYEIGSERPNVAPAPLWRAHTDWPRGAEGVVERVIAPILGERIDVVGHRVVHGGARFHDSVLITDEIRQAIDALSELAPLHNPVALAGIRAIDRLRPAVPQVAAFDTAFHWTLPEAARTYPVPRSWVDRGLRKYGFHGISHRYVARRAADILGRDPASLKVVTCHLGNGCSLCAVDGGRSVDTTMGFTPLDGLMMGSRSGAVDPGLLLHVLQREGLSAEQLGHALQHESGLLGLSGVSSDMRQVLAAADAGDAHARLAIDVFVFRLASYVGALLPSLGGLDALVFTAGIGENAAVIRDRTCARLAMFGVKLEPALNSRTTGLDGVVSSPDARVAVLVVQTSEGWEIARECARLTEPQA